MTALPEPGWHFLHSIRRITRSLETYNAATQLGTADGATAEATREGTSVYGRTREAAGYDFAERSGRLDAQREVGHQGTRSAARIGEQRRQSENFGFADGASAAGTSVREAARLDSFIRTLKATAGIPVSRRMHPRVCGFISTAVYEGRLGSDDASGFQSLVSSSGADLVGAGLRAVTHLGRSQVSSEEIEAIAAHISGLRGATYRDRDGCERAIGYADILVVAPYNAQVNALRARLPHAVRVGTVDRFQGQEAPVCLVSMTTSSGEELPRDIAFLFSLNRINVAVSRAQASAVVFASPLLLETPCRTVEKMSLVNTLCMLREYGGDSF